MINSYEDLIDESRVLKDGVFYPAPIRKTGKEQMSGQRNWQYYLWNILMIQSWLEAEN